MDDFEVEFDEQGNAIARHRGSGHAYEFARRPEAPYFVATYIVAGRTAEFDSGDFAEAALEAVLHQARVDGKIPLKRVEASFGMPMAWGAEVQARSALPLASLATVEANFSLPIAINWTDEVIRTIQALPIETQRMAPFRATMEDATALRAEQQVAEPDGARLKQLWDRLLSHREEIVLFLATLVAQEVVHEAVQHLLHVLSMH